MVLYDKRYAYAAIGRVTSEVGSADTWDDAARGALQDIGDRLSCVHDHEEKLTYVLRGDRESPLLDGSYPLAEAQQPNG